MAALAHHTLGVLALGRGFVIWLLLRGMVRAIGWPGTIAVFVVIAIVWNFARQRRPS